MANNIPVTPGSGVNVATDQLQTGEHVQIMKLMDGTEDGTERISGNAANGLDVDVTRVQGTVTVDSELTTGDLDTAGGTDFKAVVGIALAASGGAQFLQGDSTNGLKAQITNMPGASRTTDGIGAALSTDAIMSGFTILTPKFAVIAASASGQSSLVALVASKKIRLLYISLMASAGVNVKFQSNSTDITGLYYLAANTGFVLPFSPIGLFETAAGQTLNINLSSATAVGGSLAYIEV